MGYRNGSYGPQPESGTERSHESGLEDVRREAARLASYLQFGPPRAVRDRAPHPPQSLLRDWPIPPNTLSVYAIGQAMVLRGDFTQADLVALRQTFRDQLITLEDDGGEEALHTLVVWPPRTEEDGATSQEASSREEREEPAEVAAERSACPAGERAG